MLALVCAALLWQYRWLSSEKLTLGLRGDTQLPASAGPIRVHPRQRRQRSPFAAFLFVPFLGLLLILVASPAARCQQSGTQPLNEFGLWGSFSVNSPDVYGSRAHGRFGAVAFRYGRVVSASRHRVIEYTLDILPAEVMHQVSYRPCTIESGGKLLSTHCVSGHENAYGGGVSPFGWKFNFLPRRRFQIFAGLSGGFIASVARIPTDIPGGTLFNFTAEWQLGFQRYNARRNGAWIGGYKLEHISNAFRTSVDPGIDLNVLFVGYSFFK